MSAETNLALAGAKPAGVGTDWPRRLARLVADTVDEIASGGAGDDLPAVVGLLLELLHVEVPGAGWIESREGLSEWVELHLRTMRDVYGVLLRGPTWGDDTDGEPMDGPTAAAAYCSLVAYLTHQAARRVLSERPVYPVDGWELWPEATARGYLDAVEIALHGGRRKGGRRRPSSAPGPGKNVLLSLHALLKRNPEALGWSLREIAAALGCSPGTLDAKTAAGQMLRTLRAAERKDRRPDDE